MSAAESASHVARTTPHTTSDSGGSGSGTISGVEDIEQKNSAGSGNTTLHVTPVASRGASAGGESTAALPGYDSKRTGLRWNDNPMGGRVVSASSLATLAEGSPGEGGMRGSVEFGESIKASGVGGVAARLRGGPSSVADNTPSTTSKDDKEEEQGGRSLSTVKRLKHLVSSTASMSTGHAAINAIFGVHHAANKPASTLRRDLRRGVMWWWWTAMKRHHDMLAPFLAPSGEPGRTTAYFLSMMLAKYATCIASGTLLYHM